MTKQKIVFGLIALSLIAVILHFSGLFTDKSAEITFSTNATSTTSGIPGINVTGEGDFTVEPVSDDKVIKPMPSLDKKVNFSADLSGEARQILQEKIDVNIAKIKGEPAFSEIWLEFGINLKTAGDYARAKEVWEYASYLNPKDAVIYSNLGNLYGYYLNVLPLAEQNLLKAIEVEPYTANWYLRLSDFYRDVMKSSEKAKMILAAGLDKLPNDPSLKAALER